METKPNRILPTDANPEPLPPCGGSWRRGEDGGLSPTDAATAEAAGLAWSEAPAEVLAGPQATKRPTAQA